MSQDVLDVVAVDPQEPHIADQVHPAAMHEHGREQVHVLKPVRNDGIRAMKRFSSYGIQRHLVRNTSTLTTMIADRDERRRVARLCVPKRNHACLSLLRRIGFK